MKDLTKVEEIVVISVWRLGDSAYGVTVRDHIRKVTRKNIMYNTLYSTLEQLVSKGYLAKRIGEPTAVRGGKRKIFFYPTPSGLKALEAAFRDKNAVWSGISEESFTSGAIGEKQ